MVDLSFGLNSDCPNLGNSGALEKYNFTFGRKAFLKNGGKNRNIGGVFGVRPNFGLNSAEFELFKKGPIYVRSKAFFLYKEKIIIFVSKFFLSCWNRFYVA